MSKTYDIKLEPDTRLAFGEAELQTNSPPLAEAFDAPGTEQVFAEVAVPSGSCHCHVARLRHGPTLLRLSPAQFEQHGLRRGQSARLRRIAAAVAHRVVVRASDGVSASELQAALRRAPIAVGQRFPVTEGGFACVTESLPEHHCILVTPDTEIIREAGPLPETAGSQPTTPANVGPTLLEVGGLAEAVEQLREEILFPLLNPEDFAAQGLPPAPAAILYGPSGTGKTLLVRALCAEAGVTVKLIAGPELQDRFVGEAERKLRQVFAEAARHAPAVVVLDEIDSFVSRRSETSAEHTNSMVGTLLTLMDGVRERRGVAVVATTNRLNALDPALRRGGRFSLEIPIHPPSEPGRREILAILTRLMRLAPGVDLPALAGRTHGFVGADLRALCDKALVAARRRVRAAGGQLTEQTEVTGEDFAAALPKVAPTLMREFGMEVPRVTWGAVGGLAEVKRALHENIVVPLRKRASFARLGLKPARCALLHGPPGTGKTLLAKAVATESGMNFIAVKAGELLSKWVGESEANVRELFERARLVSPCVVYFDEVDALLSRRDAGSHGAHDGVVNAMLAEMDGIEANDGLFFIGTCNRSDLLDEAALRPGRFDLKIEVPLPDAEARRQILGIHIGKAFLPAADLEALVRDTEDFSGADLAEAVRRGKQEALREAGYPDDAEVAVTLAHYLRAAEQVRAAKTGSRRQIGFHTH